MRFVLVALVAAALAACDLGASSPSAEPLPSVGAESGLPSAAASSSTDASVSASASASTDASSATSMTCQEAFASIDVTSLEGMTSLDSASDVLDDTIAACGDVTEWQTTLTALVPGIDVADAETFLAARCDENDLIDDSPICEALDA